MAGIYIHIPFCKQLCSYGDFYFKVSLEKQSLMVDAMLKELDLSVSFLGGEAVDTLYFGGGTPSVLTIEEVSRIIEKVKGLYGVDSFSELTFEANPEDLTPQYLQGLQRAGVNRLSIGIQSFVDSELRFLNRRHSALSARRSVKQAQRVGFDNISIDLMYGLPAKGGQQWERSLETAMSLGVPHLSAYHLSIEPATVFGRKVQGGVISPVSEDVSREQYRLLEETAAANGYHHYEISNFALPGRESIHNSNYWRGVNYLGIGPSAHSFRGDFRRWNVSSNNRYFWGLDQGILVYEKEWLSVTDIMNEYVMVSLRTAAGVDLRHFAEKFGEDSLARLLRMASGRINAGELIVNDDSLTIPTSEFLISDAIISDLFAV